MQFAFNKRPAELLSNGIQRHYLDVSSAGGLDFTFKYSQQSSGELDFYFNQSEQTKRKNFPKVWYEYIWNKNKFVPDGKIHNDLDHISIHPNYRGGHNIFIRVHFVSDKDNPIEIVGIENNKTAAAFFYLFHRNRYSNIEFLTLLRNYNNSQREASVKNIFALQTIEQVRILEMKKKNVYKIYGENNLGRNCKKNLARIDKNISQKKKSIQKMDRLYNRLENSDVQIRDFDENTAYQLRLSPKLYSEKRLKQLYPADFNLNCVIIGCGFGYVQKQSNPNNKRVLIGFL